MTRETAHREVEHGRFHEPVGLGAGATVPGMVLIHDVWGLSPHSLALAADLASEGFGVLEIDLYRELGDFTIEAPGAFIRSLSDPAILADLDAGAAWVAGTPACRGRRVGLMGVCMGGTFTLLAACTSTRFAAAAAFYGILSYDRGMLANPDGRDLEKKPRSPLEAAPDLRMPLLASFGAQDDFVPQQDVTALEAGLSKSGQSVRIDVYDGAGHAFLNRTREEAYRSEASSAAWARLTPFLHSALD